MKHAYKRTASRSFLFFSFLFFSFLFFSFLFLLSTIAFSINRSKGSVAKTGSGQTDSHQRKLLTNKGTTFRFVLLYSSPRRCGGHVVSHTSWTTTSCTPSATPSSRYLFKHNKTIADDASIMYYIELTCPQQHVLLFISLTDVFYQDRLGTNIGTVSNTYCCSRLFIHVLARPPARSQSLDDEQRLKIDLHNSERIKEEIVRFWDLMAFVSETMVPVHLLRCHVYTREDHFTKTGSGQT
jgi:hypothetical protein